MLRYLPVVLAFGLITAGGVVQGLWSHRWSDPGPAIASFADRLADVPMSIGDWEGKDQAVDPISIKGSGAVGYVSRHYTNKVTGQAVAIWFICGHPRDIAMHTPDVCYPGSGFTQQDQTIRYPVVLDEETQEKGDFFTAVFRKQDIHTNRVDRVFWAWSRPNEPGWSAPDSARIAFGGSSALYKIYFVSPLKERGETLDQSACIDFAKVFMPEVRKVLFPEADETDASADPAASTEVEALQL